MLSCLLNANQSLLALRQLETCIKQGPEQRGVISKHGETLTNYSIRSIKDIQSVVNHFDKFPLKTQKINDYKLFKLAFNIIKNKEHLTQEGINKLLVIKSYMNKGLSPELKLAFPHINIEPLKIEARPNKIPLLLFSNVATGDEAKENAYWLTGFATGEGSFQVDIRKSKTSKSGYQVLLRFSIGQHRRDEQLLRSLIDYLNCGRVLLPLISKGKKKLNKKYNTEFF